MTTVFDVVNLFQSLKYHFSDPKHDYFKTPYVVNNKQLAKRKDHYFLQKLTRHKDLFNFLVANLSSNPKIWIGDLFKEESNSRYLNFIKKKESLSYIFKQELDKLENDFNSNFKVQEHSHPKVIRNYLAGSLSLESLIILVDISHSFYYLERMLKDDVVWKNISHQIKKYRPFVNYDKTKFKQIILDHFA